MNFLKAYPNTILKRKYFKEYTYLAEIENKEHHILVLPVTKNSILTINSKFVWEIKYGRPNGSRFNTTKSTLINLTNFFRLDNKIIVFKDKPYKILKHINECDIIDISDKEEIFGIQLYNSLR